jgi:hypothetical protein
MSVVGAVPVRWCVFASLWFVEAFFWAMFVAWTPIACDWFWWDSHLIKWCIWMMLALGVIISASACTTAWALVLMDAGWQYSPRCPTSRSRRRAAKPARA